MSADLTDAEELSSSHARTSSTASQMSVTFDLPAEADGARTDVTVEWPEHVPAGAEVIVYGSHDRFAEGTVLTQDARTGGVSATLSVPVGEFLYRFAVNGEWQTAESQPQTMLNGEEYNIMHVADPFAQAPNLDQVGATVAAAAATEPEVTDSKPAVNRRQSSVHWDASRAKLIISSSSDAATGGSDVSPRPIGTPVKSRSGPNTPKLASTVAVSPRFGGVSGTTLPAPATPLEEGDEGASSGEEEEEEILTPSGITRTKRKNRAHRAKLKQTRSLFQSPPQMRQPGEAVQTNNVMSSSAPSFMTPLSGNVGRSPVQASSAAAMQVNQLKMEALQRENEWKEAWIAHEIQTFQQREEERKTLKAQMNEERARWLQKLKDYTAELRQVRDENLQLKTDLAAAGTQKRLETSAKARVEKFQTLSKNMLNDEMMAWIKEKGQLQREISELKEEKQAMIATKEELQAALYTASGEATTQKLAAESKARELTAALDELAALKTQMAQAVAGSESKASQALAEMQSKLSEAVRQANHLRDELQTATAATDAAQADLKEKAKEIEALKAQATAHAATISQLQSEAVVLQQKALATQDSLFAQTAELELAKEDKENLESELKVKAEQYDAWKADLSQQLESARASSRESSAKILALHATCRELRALVNDANATTLSHTASFTTQLAEAQRVMTEALAMQTTLLASTMAKYKKEMSERRKLHNLVQELRGNIRVYARARPLSETEMKNQASNAVTVTPSDTIGEVSTELTLENEKGKKTAFQFDAVFGQDSTQADVFSQIVSLVTSVLDGYNVSLFAYGQTGAGKTHTMSNSAPGQEGMNLRSLNELFRLRAERAGDIDYKITCSMLEIYNEQIYDLLDANRDKELKIRQASTGVYVENLTERPVESEQDVLALMDEGNRNRSVGQTAMNATSSRSHSILSVTVHGHSSVTNMTYMGKLHLIDLAGSERVGRSNVTGDRLKEAQAINLSLSALGNVIEALQKKQSHIPYRNSKLTYILQNSLGGNAKTLMIVNCSPSSLDVDETNCSLQFASRVRSVELGAASKNVAAAPPAAGASAGSPTGVASPEPVASAPSTPGQAAKRAVASATAAAKPARPPTAGSAPLSAAKKAPVGSTPVKKPLAK